VTRKITKGVAQIAKDIREGKPITPLELGNLDARRDWTDAEDCVQAVWRMLNQEEYRDDMKYLPRGGLIVTPPKFIYSSLVPKLKEYVVSSGENHTVREFVEEAFNVVGIKGQWYITGSDPTSERYILWNSDGTTDGHSIVTVNPSFYRPAEVEQLLGDHTNITKDLKWNPITTFKGLVKKMIEADLK
jgi:GDPmannose 4,6-dehydratase